MSEPKSNATDDLDAMLAALPSVPTMTVPEGFRCGYVAVKLCLYP